MRKSTVLLRAVTSFLKVVGCFIVLGLLLALSSAPAGGAVIDGTIVRSFPSPLGVGTYGIGVDNDGVHAWVNKRGGTPLFILLDFTGSVVPGTGGNTPTSIPQGFEMDSSGELWLIDRSSNSENALRMTTTGTTTSTVSIGFMNNPNDLTLRNGDLYIVDPITDGMFHFLTDGTFVGIVAFQSGALDPAFPDTDAITYDGTNFWVAYGQGTTASKVFEIAPDGTVLSSFTFGARLLGLSYDPVNDHLLATSGNLGDTIYVIGAVPEPATLSLLALGGLIITHRRGRYRSLA